MSTTNDTDDVSTPLTMAEWLTAVRDHGTSAREVLIRRGVHHKVIWDKAMRSERRGYTESGVVTDRCWLTARGAAFLHED